MRIADEITRRYPRVLVIIDDISRARLQRRFRSRRNRTDRDKSSFLDDYVSQQRSVLFGGCFEQRGTSV